MPIKTSESLVLVNRQNGIVIIPESTPLTRLNYFDGKFLRATDLKAEQDYLRQLVRLSNQAGGPGVAHGFDLTIGSGDTITIGPGLAIDPQGRVLLLPQDHPISVDELIEKSRDVQRLFGKANVVRAGGFETCEITSETTVSSVPSSNLFLIVVSAAEALCGEEDVFGKLCEEACATSTDRPFMVEGIVVRAIPLALQTALPTSKAVSLTQTHLRSRVASAYFDDERRRVASLISKFGLEQETWCLGADAAGGSGVPIGVLARAGSSTIFIDAWTARRERMDSPARRYWQWRMMMRPWDVFMAQVLQFQCQLRDVLGSAFGGGEDKDPCGGAKSALDEAAIAIDELRNFYEVTTRRFTALETEGLTIRGGVSRIADLNKKLVNISAGLLSAARDRLLIRGGIIELPSAGYLPVTPGAAATVNRQVRQMLGDGVDLRFCVVRPDYVAHALEEAQHMERISLTQGLDDPANKPEVDVLVPNGKVLHKTDLSPGRGFEATVNINPIILASGISTFGTNLNTTFASKLNVILNGAARTDRSPSGGGAVHLSCEFQRTGSNPSGTPTTFNPPGSTRPNQPASDSLASRLAVPSVGVGLWTSLNCELNVFTLKVGDATNVNARVVVASTFAETTPIDIVLNCVLQITEEARTVGNKRGLKAHVENAQLSITGQGFGNAGPKTTHLVDFDVIVTLTNQSEIEIVLDHAKNDFVIGASWGQLPLQVTATLAGKLNSPEGQPAQVAFAGADLKEQPDVLSATNARHIQALASLELIAAALKNPTFADASARLLFPAPTKPFDELQVEGSLDWVLFHRRRNKSCTEERVEPPQLPTRRYQVFEITADAITDARRMIELIRASDVPAGRLDEVAVVEFAGGVSTMLTSTSDVLKDWQVAKPGNTIVYGAIASRESASTDGETLSRSRLERLESAVDSISRVVPDAQTEVLPKLPVTSTGASVDGVIVIVTLNQAAKTCQLAFRVTTAENFRNVVAAIKRNQIAAAITEFATPIGEVNFVAEKAEPFNDNSLATAVDKWKAIGQAQPQDSIVVVAKGDATLPQALAVQQAAAITTALGTSSTAPAPQFVEAPAAFPDTIKCPGLTFVVGLMQSQRLALVLFSTPIASAPGVHIPAQGASQGKVMFVNNVPQGTALADAFKGLPPGVGLGRVRGVTLADIAAPLDSDAQVRLTTVVNALKATPSGPQNLTQNAVVLSQADKDQLTSHNISTVGFDEVIYLELLG